MSATIGPSKCRQNKYESIQPLRPPCFGARSQTLDTQAWPMSQRYSDRILIEGLEFAYDKIWTRPTTGVRTVKWKITRKQFLDRPWP